MISPAGKRKNCGYAADLSQSPPAVVHAAERDDVPALILHALHQQYVLSSGNRVRVPEQVVRDEQRLHGSLRLGSGLDFSSLRLSRWRDLRAQATE